MTFIVSQSIQWQEDLVTFSWEPKLASREGLGKKNTSLKKSGDLRMSLIIIS